jgi:hypothetical protein
MCSYVSLCATLTRCDPISITIVVMFDVMRFSTEILGTTTACRAAVDWP